MYGRTNIFSRETPSSTTPPNNYPSTHQTTNSTFINQNRPMSAGQNIGSNRLNYVSDQFPSGIKDIVTQWKEITPMSIVCRPETLHLSSIQFRLQDYYLIRSKQIRPHNEQRLIDSIKFGSFSQQLMRVEPPAPFNYSTEKCIDLDVLRSGKGNMSSTPTFSSTNNSNNGGASNNSNNMFSRGQGTTNTNNIFSNNQNNTNTNVFTSNRNTSVGNSTSGNVFNNRSTTGGNIFSNSSSGTGANQFGGNNNSQNNTNSNNQGSTNGNVFTNNSSNNNTSSSNVFNANRANNSQSTGNNIFSNNNPGNNSNSSNIFSNNQNNQSNQNNYTGNNNQNNNTGNNLFKQAPQAANNPPNVDLNLMMHALQNYIQTNQLYMQQIIQENQNKPKQKDERPEEVPDIWQQARHKNQSNSYFQQFQEDEIRFNQSRKSKQEDCLILMPRQPKQIRRNNYKTQFQHQEYNLSYNYFTSSANRPLNNQFLPTNSVVYQQQPKNKSLRLTSHQPNKSIRLSNHPKEQFNSMIYSRYDKTIYQTKARQNKIVFEEPCKCTLILYIFWEECNNNAVGSKKVKINSPSHQKDQIELCSIDLQSQKGRKDFERELRQKSKFIRSDAKFTPDRQKCQIDHANSRIKVVGKVQQKILNISNQYEVYYSRVDQDYIYDLTISKVDVGTVVWDQAIKFETLDFSKGLEFYIEECEVKCEIEELRGSCRVTFNTLPFEIKQVMKQKGFLQARCNLEKMLKKQSAGIQFSELWESGNWSFRLKNGFTNDE